MTFYDVYVGKLDDPDLKKLNGHFPKEVAGLYLSSSLDAYWAVLGLVRSGGREYVDLGAAFAVKSRKDQIRELVSSYRGSLRESSPQDLLRKVDDLEDSELFVIVGIET